MKITIFNNNDLKKTGGFKKKNNIKEFEKQEFKQYIKNNNLTLSKGYIDNIGYISNNQMFKCNHNNMIIGVTSIINEVE